MTLYDLRGNEMYFGSRKIGKAYFNNETIFDKTVLVFPNPPQYHLSPTYAYFFGAGEENRYAGSQASLVTPGMTLQENGLLVGDDKIILPEPSSQYHQRRGIYEFTMENNFDHLEPGTSKTIFSATGQSQFYGPGWSLYQKKDVDGNTFITIGNVVDVPIMDDRAYIHIAVRYISESTIRTVRIYINGELKQLLSRESSATSTGIGAVSIFPVSPIYDFKFYGDRTMEDIITNNHNYISKLKFIKTKELVFEEPEGIPSYYQLATDSEFSGTTNVNLRYIGTKEYIIIPPVINHVKVTTFSGLFWGAPTQVKGVASEIPNITSLGSMFRDFKGTSHLELKWLDTSNVTNMFNLFYAASFLPSIGVSTWQTPKIGQISGTFRYMDSIQELDLSSFDFSQVTDSSATFDSNPKLKTIYVGNQAAKTFVENILGGGTGSTTGVSVIIK